MVFGFGVLFRVPIGPKVVPFGGSYLEFYKVIMGIGNSGLGFWAFGLGSRDEVSLRV